jgi:hypothetical protein
LPSLRVTARVRVPAEGSVMRSLYFKQGTRSDTALWSLLPDDHDPAP